MATREREVKVVVLGEDRSGSKALKQVDDAAAKLGPSGKIAENALDSVTSKLTNKLGPASNQAKDALDKVGGSAISSGGLLTTAVAGGALVAGAALAKFALDGVGALVDLAGEVRTFSRATGLSAEESSRWVSILDDMGISADVGAGSIFKLAKNTADGGAKMRDYGVEVARAKDGSTDLHGTLLNVADAYTSTHDPSKRAELLMAAFGKSGAALIPILEKGRAGIEEMFGAVKRGEVLSQKQLDDTRRFELAVDDVQDSLRTLQMEGGQALLPFITTVAEASTKTLDFLDSATQRAGGVRGVFEKVAAGAAPLAGLVTLWGKATGDAGDKAETAEQKIAAQTAALEVLGVELTDGEKKTGKLSDTTKKAAAEAEKYEAKVTQMGAGMAAAYTLMSGKSVELTAKHRDMARGMDDAKSKADQLKQGLDLLVGTKLSATSAAIRWEESIAETSATLRENKRTLDITTEAGRQNQTAIIDMIQAALGHVDALQREGASSERVTAAYGDHVQALRNVMTQAGYSKEQIEELLHRYGLLAAAPDINKRITTTHVYVQRGDRTYGGDSTAGIGQYAIGMEKGPIPGGRSDIVPILAHGGEWVVTPEQMARLRGGSAAGGDGSWAAPSAGTMVIVNVYGTVTTANGLAEDVQAALLQKLRRVPSLGLS